MVLFLHVLQAYCISALIAATDSYVLLAANIDDFRNIVKKFIPEKLAGELTEIVSESSLKFVYDRDDPDKRKGPGEDKRPKIGRNENSHTHDEIFNAERVPPRTSESVEQVTSRGKLKQIGDKKPLRNTNYGSQSDNDKKSAWKNSFENDKMQENGYEHSEFPTTYADVKYKRYRTIKRLPSSRKWYEKPLKYDREDENNSEYSNKPVKNNDEFNLKRESKKTVENFDDVRNTDIEITEKDYVEQTERTKIIPTAEDARINGGRVKKTKVNKEEINNGNDLMFEQVMMGKKKDSYEDYVTPKKDYEFESTETTKERKVSKKTQSRDFKEHKVFDSEEAIDPYTKKEKITIERTEQKKQPKKERIDDVRKPKERIDDVRKPKEPGEVKARTESLLFDSVESNINASVHVMKGTGIPTRQFYTMSTPDYYKKLPRIVEKYDFNEPIPEADREREVIDDKYAQEPARVNKKVKKQQRVAKPPLDKVIEEMSRERNDGGVSIE